MFALLFVIGAVGFLAMTFLSFGFGHNGGFKSGHALPSGHSPVVPHAHTGPIAHVAHQVAGAAHLRSPGHTSPIKNGGRFAGVARYFYPSPLDVFSVCLGIGAAGLILQNRLSGTTIIWVAVLCGLAYNWILIHPVMNFCLRFVSKESKGLEGAVSSEVEAVLRFDAQGRGLVRLTLDGQIVQLLATLDSLELGRGVTVSKGDTVVILEVDATRNTCRVSRDLAV